jgi:hypothetical protein
MKQLSKPANHTRMIEDHIVRMRYRDTIASMHVMLLDLEISHCELAVDAAFSRANYTAPREVQRP